MFVVIAKQRSLAGKAEVLKENVAKLAPQTRQYPGCLKYELLQSREDENQFMFYEIWENEEAFEKHFHTDFTKDFEKTLDGVVDGAVEPFVMDVVV